MKIKQKVPTVRAAAIDIGTNSTRLLIADHSSGDRLIELTRASTVTRLGELVDQTGMLQPQAKQRVLRALHHYHKLIEEKNVHITKTVLTSAARDAKDGELFAAEIRSQFGFPAEVISEQREMMFTATGVLSCATPPTRIIDIGGGSTEIIVSNRGQVEWGVSLPLGVVRSTERHLKSDPPDPRELKQLAAEVRELIVKTIAGQGPLPKCAMTYAVAGTPTSAAAIAQKLEPYDRNRVHGFQLSRDTCKEQLALIASLPVQERVNIPGLHPDRATMIVTGLTILNEILFALDIDSLIVSEHDLLYGLAKSGAREELALR